MKERPILFKGEMVRAILDGSKTQTRRVVKQPQPMAEDGFKIYHAGNGDWFYQRGDIQWALFKCPYGQIGDRLWVRETYSIATGNGTYPVYRADAIEDDSGERDGFWVGDNFYSYEGTNRWHPSLHMPRWASRITLEITGVRVERLREISREDAKAEGITWIPNDGYRIHGQPGSYLNAMDAFRDLWNSLAKPGATWGDSPWVWVVEFKRVQP